MGDRGWDPDWTMHPGVLLGDWMRASSVTPRMFARASGISVGAIERLVACDPTLRVTTTFATLIERGTHALGLGPSAAFWSNAERIYREALARGVVDTSTEHLKGTMPMTTGAELIAAERERQINDLGFSTRDHDEDHKHNELTRAAIAFAWSALGHPDKAQSMWPFPEEMHKGESVHRDLVKAGALIAAELDRLGEPAEATTP